MQKESLYKIIFHNQSQVYEVYTKSVSQADLFGFLQIDALVFGNRSQVLVDPGEEKLKSEFTGVKRSYIPMHSIIRIDEVDQEGVATVRESNGSSNISLFPGPSGPRPKPTS